MGSGIAQCAALAEYDVALHDVRGEQLGQALHSVEESLERLTRKEKISAGQAAAALARITTTTTLEKAAADADFVVEAVVEDLGIKQVLFRQLDGMCRPDTVLASNTSALPITGIASATTRPDRVVGTHFFSPVPMMRLCEVVRGVKTTDGTLKKAQAFAADLGKTCVVVNRDLAGFVTTRLIVALSVEAVKLVENGVATAEDVDTACRLGFGHAMGPLETMDLTGVDVFVNAARNIYTDTADPKFYPPELSVRMAGAGDHGRKTGKGWYDHG
ncbi:3-hydroxyacyl-CoA dehydrogenase family protein [Streptomyces armeniacus]|uniref:3-hydroxyacyl-CoA dehydrogenase family protein n=1 Tax=Streptomyces armeniacus TaxID=83291 RepID=A0A345XLE5_9ACTN|nr:3-hydroxyacyl-CoA dehydrogenase family protein [Streptomyces armeniacus]